MIVSNGAKVPSNEAIYFESYYTSLINSKFLMNKAAILQLLFKLAGNNSIAASFGRSAHIPSPFVVKPVSTPGAFSVSNQSDNFSSAKQSFLPADSLRFSSSLPQKVSSVISQIVSHDKGGRDNCTCFRYCVVICVVVAEISEARLVRDVLFTFQGIDGVYIKFDDSLQAFAVTSSVCMFS